jgi:hypothetical protein
LVNTLRLRRVVLGTRQPRSSLRRLQLRRRAQINAENRKSRIAQLEELVVEQHNEIALLIDRLATYENGPATERAKHRPQPRIF